MLIPINVLAWNNWGASKVDSIRYLSKICSENAIRLLILLEPISGLDQLEVLCRRAKFDHAVSFIEGKMWFL